MVNFRDMLNESYDSLCNHSLSIEAAKVINKGAVLILATFLLQLQYDISMKKDI